MEEPESDFEGSLHVVHLRNSNFYISGYIGLIEKVVNLAES